MVAEGWVESGFWWSSRREKSSSQEAMDGVRVRVDGNGEEQTDVREGVWGICWVEGEAFSV